MIRKMINPIKKKVTRFEPIQVIRERVKNTSLHAYGNETLTSAKKDLWERLVHRNDNMTTKTLNSEEQILTSSPPPINQVPWY